MKYFLVGRKQLEEEPVWAERIGAAMAASYNSRVSRPATQVREAIERGASFIVSLGENMKVKGYARIIMPASKEKPVYVTEIAIRPEHRNAGGFRGLKRRAEESAYRNGFPGIEFRYVLPKIARIFEREKTRGNRGKAPNREIEISEEEFLGGAGAKKIVMRFKNKQATKPKTKKRKPMPRKPL